MSTMDEIERMYREQDHAEALTIERQLTVAPPGVTADNVIALNRFCDCCDDGEGYDVPKEAMRALKQHGLVEGGRFGWYSLTSAGQRVRDYWFDANVEEAP